jgi:ribonuclease E
VAAYLLNEKRAALSEIELVSKTRVLVIPNPNLETPHFEVQRLRDDEVDGASEVSYDVDIAVPDAEAISDSHSADIPVQQAAVQRIAPKAAPAPSPTSLTEERKPAAKAAAAAPKKGLLARLFSGLMGSEPEPEPVAEPAKPVTSDKPKGRSGQKSQGNRNRRRGGQNRGEQRPRNQDGQKKEAHSDDDRDQQKRHRSNEDSGRGNGQGRRRGGRDGQRRRPEAAEEAANESLESVAAESKDTEDSNDNSEKPRKRPNDMKRGEPQRRRRNRGRKPAAAESSDKKEIDGNVAAEVQPQSVVEASTTTPEAPSTTDAVTDVVTEAPVTPVAESAPVSEQAEPQQEADTAPTVIEDVPVVAEEETAVQETPMETVEPELAEAAATPEAEEPVVAAGLNEQGLAINDPRVEAQPVGVVEIVTTHPALFGDEVAPPVAPSAKVVTRSSNDPRGPAQRDEPHAEAAGNS